MYPTWLSTNTRGGHLTPAGGCQEPILRLLNLQLQRQRCSRLERFYIGEKFLV
jgi:hypothetical protein